MTDVHDVIYLQPVCADCRSAFDGQEFGRMWCQDDVGPCEECGADWLRYRLDRAALASVEDRP